MTACAPRFLLHPSTQVPGEGIWFGTPTGFTELPLGAFLDSPDSSGAEGLHDPLTACLASAPDEETRERFAGRFVAAQRILRTLYAQGAVHCSIGLHRDDTGEGSGGALLSLFTVAWVPTAWAPRRITVARSVTQSEGHSRIEYTELPCGPVAFSEKVATPAADSRLPQRRLLQIHAYVAHPDGTSLALLTLSTTAVNHRGHYRAILRRIAELVSFDDPGVPTHCASAH